MFIKSDETKSINWTKVIDGLDIFFRKMYVRLIIFIFLLTISIGIWEYSGLISFWFSIMSFTVLINKSLEDVIAPAIVTFIPLMIASSFNIYHADPVEKEMEISMYEFVDSTEKLIVYIDEPIEQTLVFDTQIDSNKYFTLKKNDGDDMTGKIIRKNTYDHIDKLSFNSEPSKRFYDIEFVLGDVKHTIKDYGNCDSCKENCVEFF